MKLSVYSYVISAASSFVSPTVIVGTVVTVALVAIIVILVLGLVAVLVVKRRQKTVTVTGEYIVLFKWFYPHVSAYHCCYVCSTQYCHHLLEYV